MLSQIFYFFSFQLLFLLNFIKKKKILEQMKTFNVIFLLSEHCFFFFFNNNMLWLFILNLWKALGAIKAITILY